MSNTEIHKGKMRLVESSLTKEDFMKDQLQNEGYSFDSNNIAYDFFEHFYEKYFISKSGRIYEILEDEELDEDVREFTNNPDGTIDYIVMFYNGGACLTDILETCED